MTRKRNNALCVPYCEIEQKPCFNVSFVLSESQRLVARSNKTFYYVVDGLKGLPADSMVA
jgi:hypothetical protein